MIAGINGVGLNARPPDTRGPFVVLIEKATVTSVFSSEEYSRKGSEGVLHFFVLQE